MNKPLEGIKVLDLSRFISGPYGTMLLGDLGADVVKVEKKGKGDDTRTLPPFINDESVYYFAVNRNKRSMELDFRSEEGKKILFEMASGCDILFENFRAGTIDKMGCSYEALKKVNPGIIMISISGFGSSGPYKDRPGFDAAIQAMSGLASITGESEGSPMMYGTYNVDYATALYATISALTALMVREKTGKGQYIEISLLESAASLLLTGIPVYYKTGAVLGRIGNRDRYTSPGNMFKTKDGVYVMMIAGNQQIFVRLCRAMNKETLLEDERFAEQNVRFQHAKEIEDIVAEWYSTMDYQDISRLLDENGIVYAKVESVKDICENPQLMYRNKFVTMEHPAMGEMTMLGLPMEFSDIKPDLNHPAPMLGQHSIEVLRQWLNLDEDEIEALQKNNVI